MTVVVYHQGCLAADSRGVLEFNDTHVCTPMQKIFTNSDHSIAVGVTGIIPSAKEMEEIFTLFEKKIFNPDYVPHFSTEELMVIRGCSSKEEEVRKFIVMTKDEGYYTHRNELLVIPSTTGHAIGSGLHGAMLCLRAGLTPKEAVARVCKIIGTCSLPVVFITSEELSFYTKSNINPNTVPEYATSDD